MGHRENTGPEHLAASLRQAWKASRLSLAELARRAGFSDRSYLSRAFSGKQTLSLPALKSVAGVLKVDYQQLLHEADLDEEVYRSRHIDAHGVSTPRGSIPLSLWDFLSEELLTVRDLKRDGKPEEARGAIGSVERLLKHHLSGFPRDRRTMLTWAALLSERVGIVQDVQLAGTVVATAEEDLREIAVIGTEYEASDIVAVGHFYAGDTYLKDQDYLGALPHYAWAVAHAPTLGLRMRSLAGWAIGVASVQRSGDEQLFWNLRGQVTELLAQVEEDSAPEYVWDSERWLLASLWSEATLARSLVVFGEHREAEEALERLTRRYESVAADGFAYAPFAMSLAQLRFLGACEGVFDMSEDDIRGLGVAAHRLAEDGSCLRTRREIETAMAQRFGFHEW